MQISSRMSAGRAFHAVGPEKENALSPNFVRRRGTSYRPLSVDRRRIVDLAEVGSTMSARYTGDLPLCMECISRQFILYPPADGQPMQLDQTSRDVVRCSQTEDKMWSLL